MEVLHSSGNNPRSGNAVFRIGVLEALRATPNLETESSSLETICLSMVEDKSILHRCILHGLKELKD